MKPVIKATKFGVITVSNRHIDYDFFINANGKLLNRNDSLHFKDKDSGTLSLGEASALYDPTINEMIIGSNRRESFRLSEEATDFFEEKRYKIKMLPMLEAIAYWNRYEGHAIGLFHVE